MNTREEALAVLRAAAQADGERPGLAEAALALAALDRPRVGLERYRRHLDLLAREVAAEVGAAAPAGADIAACMAALNRVLFERQGYDGDAETYDDLQNANLIRVIDRRKGLPVSLGILYLHAGRAQGWALSGLAFPGHFLVRLDHGESRVIIDPFARGRVQDPAGLRALLKASAGTEAELAPAHYAAVSDLDILLRLQNNVKLRLLRDERIDRAIGVIETMMVLAPGQAGLWRESGLLHARLGNLRTAVAALERYVEMSRADEARHRIASLLQRLRARLN